MPLTDFECMRVTHMLFNITRAYDMYMGMDALNMMVGFNHQDLGGLVVIGQQAPLTSRQLSKVLGITPGTTSTYVQKLVEKGLIEKKQDQVDRRIWWLSLSDEGAKVYQAVIASTVQFTRNFSAALNDEEQAHLFSLLNKAYKGVMNIMPSVSKKARFV